MTDWLYDNIERIVVAIFVVLLVVGLLSYRNRISDWKDACHDRGGRVTSTGQGHNLCLSSDGKILDSR